jgi:hypothetical protein
MAWQARLIDGLANVFSGFLSKYVFDWKARRMITSSPFMSCREVLDLAEVVVDSLRFAGEGGCLSGKLELSSLARLHDLLTGRDGRLDCELSGDCIVDADGRRKSFLHLRVSGQLKMRCQRCLGDVDWQCAVVSHLLLVPENAAWPEGELEACRPAESCRCWNWSRMKCCWPCRLHRVTRIVGYLQKRVAWMEIEVRRPSRRWPD